MKYDVLATNAESWPPFAKTLVFHLLLRPIRKILFKLKTLVRDSEIPLEQNYIKFCDLMEVFDTRNLLSTAGAGGSGSIQQRYLETTRHQWQFFDFTPKFSILLPVYKVSPKYLREALASIALQTYPNWEVCIVDDASNSPELTSVINGFSEKYPEKVKFSTNLTNRHISYTSNECLKQATGEWCVLLDHDDRLYPNALFEILRFINLTPHMSVFYSDEVVIREDGQTLGQTFFKPGWSPILNLQTNYCAHLCAYRTSLIRQIGGFRVGYEGSQDHDLIMRAADESKIPPVHVPFCLYQWRVHPQSTASSINAKPYAAENGIKAVVDTCKRRGLPLVGADYNSKTFHYDLQFQVLGQPRVSIMIPTRNQFELLKRCVDSILFKSSWQNLEIIVVDNGTDDRACLDWLDVMSSQKKLKVVRDDRGFNFAALNNLAAKQANGEYLVLLNNDTEVVSPSWIEDMLQYAQMQDVGCVGARLLYEDGTIQHAGGVLTGYNIANHAFKKLSETDRRYIDAIVTTRECSFVTGACLMIKRSKYLAADGLNEAFIPNGYGDVDLCLRLTKDYGFKHIYAAKAVLRHYESKSRGKSVETFERLYMLQKWAQDLCLDPFLNFNLARDEFFESDHNWHTTVLKDRHFGTMLSDTVAEIFS